MFDSLPSTAARYAAQTGADGRVGGFAAYRPRPAMNPPLHGERCAKHK